MLAIQRPRMGSTQPSDVNLPFGYPSQDFLFLDPPEPAPGAPLLSDNETKFLSNFLEDMTSDHFATTSFGEGLNFSDDWLSLPPQFMGTATSFGQHPTPSLASPTEAMSNMGFQDIMPTPPAMMPPPPPPHSQRPLLEQHASADVLEAAAVLQNGSMARSSSMSHDPRFGNRDIQPGMPPPVGHLRHQPLNEFKREERRLSQTTPMGDHDHTFTEMMFGPIGQLAPRRPSQPPVDVQWGSDANFVRDQGFVPPSEKETSAALENERLQYMGCLEVNRSAASTRPSSPIFNGHGSPLKLKTRDPVPTVKREDVDADAPPKKRRKSRAKEDAEEEDDEQSSLTSKAPARKRKSKGENLSATPPVAGDGAGKRRKSGANGVQKPARENLTEEQKRENHIKSEQKRRTLIKEGFDDLCDLVPGLKGGGFSKSVMLTMAAEWLEEVMKGNQQLAAQLDRMEGR
ncbi:BHLH family transcription factor [Pleurostoma richardsiae]|uniref:BHLH family transcription factor n=1 Tax=Pleurostoma richardsiae TaxID=41990 RepID=A0AA38RJK2_9PEZI|nr:BHLH family transcription factor [Pleurostoma richardsiae]